MRGTRPGSQDPASRPSKPDPQIAAILKQLGSAMRDRKMTRDNEAAGIAEKLGSAYQRGLHKSDAKKVVKALADVLQRGKLRPPLTPLYRTAAAALGKMSDAGGRALCRVYDAKRFPRKQQWAPMRAIMLREVGNTHSLDAVDFLIKRANRASEDDVLAAAGEALGNYQNAHQKVRKRIAKELIKKLGGIEATAQQPIVTDPNQPMYFAAEAAKRTLRAIEGRWGTTLAKLTGQRLEDGTAWQRWYNKNKSRNWDVRESRRR